MAPTGVGQDGMRDGNRVGDGRIRVGWGIWGRG